MDSRQLITTLSMLVVVSCTSAEQPAVGEERLPMLSMNMLSMNMLSMNMLSMNMLSMNMLSMNMLTVNGLQVGTVGDSGLHSTDDGRQLLKYVVRCALPQGESLQVQVDGTSYEFQGLLGLAPRWRLQPLERARDRQKISACLMAHVNYFAVPVPISVRHPRLVVSDEEAERFISHEGAFYGDLFADEPVLYACSGDTAPNFDVAYPEHDTQTGDRLLRRCTDPEGPGSDQTMCGFQYVGACSDVCDISTIDGHRGCWSNADHTGVRYGQTINVFLLGYDDPDAAWPALYPVAYGSD